VEALKCRLLPYEVNDGPTNMAADEVLLLSAANGIASLRFYGWSTPTVSLGYFQSHHELDATPELRKLPLVRRATGGKTLVHHHELTYCLAIPRTAELAQKVWLDMHGPIAAALARLGVVVHPHATTSSHTGPLCFHAFTSGDLMLNGHKVVGSAQRKHHGAIMQHGGILLAQSPHTPSLPGIRELTGKEIHGEMMALLISERLKAEAGLWTDEEREQTTRLSKEKYGDSDWTFKR